MGVFAMFRRKRKGTAEDVAEVSAEAAATGTGVTEESDEAATAEADGPVTRVPVAGVTAPAEPPSAAPADGAVAEAVGAEADGAEAVSSAPAESDEDNAPEAAGAVAEVVEIPRQQSVATAADAGTTSAPDTGTAPDADSETGEAARR